IIQLAPEGLLVKDLEELVRRGMRDDRANPQAALRQRHGRDGALNDQRILRHREVVQRQGEQLLPRLPVRRCEPARESRARSTKSLYLDSRDESEEVPVARTLLLWRAENVHQRGHGGIRDLRDVALVMKLRPKLCPGLGWSLLASQAQ